MDELLRNPANYPVAAVGLLATLVLFWQIMRTQGGQGPGRKSRWSRSKGGSAHPAETSAPVSDEACGGLSPAQLEKMVGGPDADSLVIDLSAANHPVLSDPQQEPEYTKLVEEARAYWVSRVCEQTPFTGRMNKTDNFTIVGNSDHARGELGKTLEPVLADLRQALPAKEAVELWPGRMPVLLCSSAREFKEVGEKVDGVTPDPSMTGYFRGYEPLGHMVYLMGVGEAGVYLDLVNHVGRAFLFHYGPRTKQLPRWAEEGTILALQANCEYGAGMREDMQRLVSRSDSFTRENFEQIFGDSGFDSEDANVSQSAHALAFCICDFLIQQNIESYSRMLCFLKEMDDCEEVLITTYGWGFLDLQEEVQQACGIELLGEED